ncbi:MAG: hybrid sensor histidine kinase/response regulator transcription factor, partial [Bacteroidota bacterium]
NRIYLLHNNRIITYDLQANQVVHTTNNGQRPSVAATVETVNSWFIECNGSVILMQGLAEGGIMTTDLSNRDISFIEKGNKNFHITAVARSVTGKFVWLGTDDGNIMQLIPGEQNQLRNVTDQIPQLSGKRVKIWSILETADDLLWIGTDGEGVFRTLLRPKPFFQIQRGTAENRQLNHQIVRAVYEDQQGNLWVGTRGNGLNMIPRNHGPTKYFNTANGLTNNAVLALREDTHKNLWIGHDGNGIDILNLETGKFYHFPDDLKGGEHLVFGSVYDICIDAFGQIWLGTSGYGVLGLDISFQNNEFLLNNYTHLVSDEKTSSIRSNIVYSIAEEKPNVLWLGTRGAGLYRYNTLTGTLENYTMTTGNNPGLNDNDILSLHLSKNGYLWVGSSGGLNRININFSPFIFESYTTRDGLPNNTIHAILEDTDGNIWMSTNKGLSQFLVQEKKFLNFNIGDGLQSNEYTDGSAGIGQKSGRFYFGGINGLDWFHPDQISISQRQPALIFTGFRLHSQKIMPGDSTHILTKNLNELEQIRLKHHQNFFTLEFTTLDFHNPEKTLFEYKLEGFNTDWVFAGNQREASFTNVPYGRYTLMVRATNEDGVWLDETRQVRIIISPPFWKTWQAWIVYVLLAVTGIFFLYRYQLHRLKRKQRQVLEKIKQDKEKELTQYKLEFFTNLAHEFGTPLTLIFASAASLLNPRRKAEETTNLVKTIYNNSKRMQRLVQELLEFRKIETGRELVKPVKTDLVNSINNIVEVFSHFARDNEVEISFEPEENELFVMIDISKVEKILLNLLSNAIKYTPEGGSIKVELFTQNQKIIIRVVDTGVGISENVLPYIFDSFYQKPSPLQERKTPFKGIGIGLAYTKSLVELLQGQIRVNSVRQTGTTFTIELPLVNANGTILPGESNPAATQRWLTTEGIAEELGMMKTQEVQHTSRPTLWTTPKKYRILVAEDDPELANLLFRLLSEQYEVTLTSNGKKALAFIENNRVDLVVSDIIMPEMDGLQLCKTLKSELLTSHIPVILLTARNEIENRIEGLEMGADSYIPKPFHPRHLFVRMEKLLKAKEQFSEYFKKTFGTPSYSHQQNFSSRDKELIEKCQAFIEAHYADESIDADQMADHLALSKAQLYRKIKALTGLTPHGLIKNYRLKKARQLIAEGNYPVSDIIFMTGFNNRTYFYRSYKEAFGETPSEINKTQS